MGWWLPIKDWKVLLSGDRRSAFSTFALYLYPHSFYTGLVPARITIFIMHQFKGIYMPKTLLFFNYVNHTKYVKKGTFRKFKNASKGIHDSIKFPRKIKNCKF